MSTGRTTSLTISLPAADRGTLEGWQRSQTVPVGRCRRARILLLLDAGVPITRIATTVGIGRRYVYKWVARYLAQGVAGLVDLPKGKRPRRAQEDTTLDASQGLGGQDDA